MFHFNTRSLFTILIFLFSLQSFALYKQKVYYPSSHEGVLTEKIDGNTFFYGTNWGEGEVRFNFDIPESGYYLLTTNVFAPTYTTNSFYLEVPILGSKAWHIQRNPNPNWMFSGRIYLEKGVQTVTFRVREPGTMIADAILDFDPNQSLNLYSGSNSLLSNGIISFNNYSNEAYSEADFTNDFGSNTGFDSLDENHSKVTKNGIFKATIKRNSLANESGIIANSRLHPGTDYLLSYNAKFANNFIWERGGKLPGLKGGDGNAGGDPGTDGRGWSVRLMWRENGLLFPYVYHADQAIQYGESLGAEDYFVSTNQWFNVKIFVRVNSGADSNGILIIKINDEVILDKRDMRFATVNGYHDVNRFAFHVFRGGGTDEYKSSSNSAVFFDDILIHQFREFDYLK